MLGAYAISKAADMQLARNLAQELSPDNIRVNCIAPGLVKTDFAKALWDTPEGERRASEATPLRRLGEPDDIAGAAVFLASRAGAWTTGQTIVVDGGGDELKRPFFDGLASRPPRSCVIPAASAGARRAGIPGVAVRRVRRRAIAAAASVPDKPPERDFPGVTRDGKQSPSACLRPADLARR